MKININCDKIVIISLFMLSSAFSFAQVSIYKTVDEYKNNKPSLTGDRISAFGNFVLYNGKDKQKLDSKNIWGYRDKNRDYRIIEKEAHFIATKGFYYVYSGAGDSITVVGDSVIYHKGGNGYAYISKGVDGTPQIMHSHKDFLKMIEPAKAAEIDKIFEKEKKDPKSHPVNMFGKITYKNTLTSFVEDLVDYYNSTKPGYLGKRFNTFIYIY